jgi:hypothetical protein
MDPAPCDSFDAPDTFESLAEAIVTVCELIRRLEALRPWNRERPHCDCAHWLNATCGLDLVTAREKVRIAHALDDLPRITDAFREGALSYSKVRAITRIATRGTEDELIELARATTAEHVSKLVRARRQADHLSAPGSAVDAWTHRHLDYRVAEDGSVVFEGRLPAEQGALLLKALERASDWLRAEDRAEPWRAFCERAPDEVVPERQHPPQRRADALTVLAERFLARVPETDEFLTSADRFLVTVHAPAEALPEFSAIDPEDPPTFEDGAVAAPETVRRLGCDAAVVRILESGAGEPLDVGRKTRVIPPSIRRALRRRDGGCRFPGCTNTRFVDGHHIIHWADGGSTALSNLVSLCRFHHRLVHEGGYYVVPDEQSFRFFRGDGLEVRSTTQAFRRIYAEAARQSITDAKSGVRISAGYATRSRPGAVLRPP